MQLTAPISNPVGMGDLVKKVTTKLGVRPCSSCAERAAKLNRLLTVIPLDLLPPGWKLVQMTSNVLLVKNKLGTWGTWYLRNGQLKDGHFFCSNCLNSEQQARDDYIQRIKLCR